MAPNSDNLTANAIANSSEQIGAVQHDVTECEILVINAGETPTASGPETPMSKTRKSNKIFLFYSL